MGVAPYIAEAIIREHSHRPIAGDVFLLGRQAMFFSPEQAIEMVKAAGQIPRLAAADCDIDERTKSGQGHGYIRDDAFFRLLGVSNLRALDHTDYEGAEIVHDLNEPVPSQLADTADFILDGSTLDNIFSPATALQSIARMLRPGGRLLATNMGSFHFSPYTVASPYWYLDFFSVNQFSDCRVYVTTHGSQGELNVYAADPTAVADRPFMPTELTGIVVFAEKGSTSTWHKAPSQRHYSDARAIAERVEIGRRYLASRRPELLNSTRPKPFSYLRSIQNILVSQRRMVLDYKIVDAEGVRRDLKSPLLVELARFAARRRLTPH